MEENPLPPVKPRRRWFQYSLRTLLILTTIIAVWLAWWSHKTRQQREVVEALKDIGGDVIYDFQLPNGPAYWPKWLVNAMGVDYFAGVIALGLWSPIITDNHMEQVKNLTELQFLDLEHTHVSDTGLEHLRGLTDLQHLDLRYTKVTEAGVARLQQALPNCKIER